MDLSYLIAVALISAGIGSLSAVVVSLLLGHTHDVTTGQTLKTNAQHRRSMLRSDRHPDTTRPQPTERWTRR